MSEQGARQVEGVEAEGGAVEACGNVETEERGGRCALLEDKVRPAVLDREGGEPGESAGGEVGRLARWRGEEGEVLWEPAAGLG